MEPRFKRADTVPIEDYNGMLAGIVGVLIAADIGRGYIPGSDTLTPPQIEARIVVASQILYQVYYPPEEA